MRALREAIVVKLGGSLLEHRSGGAPPLIDDVLDIVGRAGRPVVVVPGGGAFADTVRAEQRRLGLSDALAHRMALLAMHQTALALLDLWPRPPAGGGCRPIVADSRAAIADALMTQRVPIWAPLAMTDRDSTLAEDWSATSDGLAAWLAARLGAREVVLVKSCRVPPDAGLADLAAAGITDPMFRDVAGAADLRWQVLGADDGARLAAALAGDTQRR